MTRPQAADALEAVLARENAALAALDFASIGGWLAAKQAAITALAAARDAPPRQAQTQALQVLALENRRLLEHALHVQQRVLGVVARAAARQERPGYGPGGCQPASRATAMVLRARA